MGCGHSKEKDEKPAQSSVDSSFNVNYNYEDIGEEEEWAAIKQKSRNVDEDRNPETVRRSTAFSLNSEGGRKGSGGSGGGEEERALIESEDPEWWFECVQRMEIDKLEKIYSLSLCRFMESSTRVEIKEISSCRSQPLVDSKLRNLLQEEAAEIVVGGRTTLPRTLPAKKQLAINIIVAKRRLSQAVDLSP